MFRDSYLWDAWNELIRALNASNVRETPSVLDALNSMKAAIARKCAELNPEYLSANDKAADQQNEQLADTMQEEYDKQKIREAQERCLDPENVPDNDPVNNPWHYQSMVKGLNIDAITCMRAAFGDEAVASFCICNSLKYIYRHLSKNGRQDIEKAQWYLNKYLELTK